MNLKFISIQIFLTLIIIITGCSDVYEKPLNTDDFDEIQKRVNDDETLGEMKKKFIIDNLEKFLSLAELGKTIKGETIKLKTYGQYIGELKKKYDSTKSVILDNRANNKKIEQFINLVDAKTVSVDKYKGYLQLMVNFKNDFEKEVMYTIISYKYVNEYDTKYFESKVKITDKVANNFKGEVELTTTETYNDVSDFIFTKVPVQAPLKLRKELGVEKANKKVESEFLMKGLKIETLLIVFKDKTELSPQNDDWAYLEE